MVQCHMCGKEFLTEADPHALSFQHGGMAVNCGCYFTKPLQSCIELLEKIIREKDVDIENLKILYDELTDTDSELIKEKTLMLELFAEWGPRVAENEKLQEQNEKLLDSMARSVVRCHSDGTVGCPTVTTLKMTLEQYRNGEL